MHIPKLLELQKVQIEVIWCDAIFRFCKKLQIWKQGAWQVNNDQELL